MGIGDAHTTMRGLHIPPCVLAGATARLADLVKQIHLEAWDVRGGEKAIDTVIGCHTSDEVINHRGGWPPSHPVARRATSPALPSASARWWRNRQAVLSRVPLQLVDVELSSRCL